MVICIFITVSPIRASQAKRKYQGKFLVCGVSNASHLDGDG